MDIRQLRVFVAVAESGSVTRAAHVLGVAQPSVSQHVRRLEEDLGVRLFDRTARGTRLTDAGTALLPRARAILREMSRVRADLSHGLERGAGSITLGAIPTMAPYLLPAAIGSLRREMPDLAVTIREAFTADLVQAVIDNELDLAIVSTPIDHESIELDVVGRESLMLIAPRDHALCARATVSIADLAPEPAIVLHEMHCLGRQIESLCAAGGVRRSVVCRTAQLATIFELVAVGLGVSIVPAMAACAGRSRAIRAVPLAGIAGSAEPDGHAGAGSGPAPSREIACIRRRDRSLSRGGARLTALLRHRLAEASP